MILLYVTPTTQRDDVLLLLILLPAAAAAVSLLHDAATHTSSGNNHGEQYPYYNDIPKNPQSVALKLISQPTTSPIPTYHPEYLPKVL